MLYLLSVTTFSLCQDIPFIESIEPAFGGFESTIILNGGNFSTNDIDNTVFFGGLEANILNANFEGANLNNATWADGKKCGLNSIGKCNSK